MNPPGLIPFGVSVLERACMNPPGLIPFGVSVLERRYNDKRACWKKIQKLINVHALLLG